MCVVGEEEDNIDVDLEVKINEDLDNILHAANEKKSKNIVENVEAKLDEFDEGHATMLIVTGNMERIEAYMNLTTIEDEIKLESVGISSAHYVEHEHEVYVHAKDVHCEDGHADNEIGFSSIIEVGAYKKKGFL